MSRVIIRDNQPSKTIVEKVSLTRQALKDFQNSDSQYKLEPYDNVFVRYVPEFELQQNVTIIGEVKLPKSGRTDRRSISGSSYYQQNGR